MPIWPGNLPQAPLAEGYEESPGETVLRTPMDVGPAKQRPLYTVGVKQMTMTWELDGSQLSTLETFFDTTLLGGALAFELPHPRTGVLTSVRFTQPPPWPRVESDLYHLQTQLEVLP